jgi:hypothetical protein
MSAFGGKADIDRARAGYSDRAGRARCRLIIELHHPLHLGSRRTRQAPLVVGRHTFDDSRQHIGGR